MAAAPALVHPEPPFPAHVLTCAGGSAPQALGVVPPPDYDWEMDRGSQHSVSCVSLGCSCAVAACLSYLKLRDAAYPFDWNRTTIEGVIHFLRTGFADFLQFAWVQAFPGGKATGGNSYHGAHHSIWHEDMGTADGPSKYQRRIRRFFHNTASRLLFIRILNSSTELANARHLLQILQVLFSRSEVYLLLIVVCQLAVRSFVVDGTRGRLLVHWIVQWPHDVLVYKDAILFGHRQASAAEGHLPDPSVRIARSCEDMLSLLIPFFGGPPQQVPFCPRPLVPLLLPGQAGPQELLPCAPAQDPAALTQTAAVLQLAGAMPMQYPVAGAVWKAGGGAGAHRRGRVVGGSSCREHVVRGGHGAGAGPSRRGRVLGGRPPRCTGSAHMTPPPVTLGPTHRPSQPVKRPIFSAAVPGTRPMLPLSDDDGAPQ
eukprot:CAMPEP_0179059000 /NCGR_PEP_ID=MMETSP0796-20121207/25134_1 /TAXON_ID=73915 /ORGANISM="Pyrodinium bahamense, Strain pbaha01" /LENGTH=426 /DNA_ID=CAMNT_0020755757 /DNA_START=105 /DNA_END=1383 /DNA_ORIENTATION=-